MIIRPPGKRRKRTRHCAAVALFASFPALPAEWRLLLMNFAGMATVFWARGISP
ncbi:MAG: hypothetical protein ACREV7_18405 [Steroidobacteraceae bacterium]